MATEVIIPSLGEVVESVTILNWFKSEGDPVDKGEPLLEVESQKVTVEIESPTSGILGRILFPKGSTVSITEVVAVILAEGESLPGTIGEALPGISQGVPDFTRKKAQISGKKSDIVRAAPMARKLAQQYGIDLSLVTPTGPHGTIMKKDVEAHLTARPERATAASPSPPAGSEERIKASPLARSIAEAHDLNLSAMKGSGPGGKIVKADIEQALEDQSIATEREAEKVTEEGPKPIAVKEILDSIPIQGVRRVIFDNMYQSLSQSAQLTIHTEASAESLIRLRKRLSQDEQKVSYNAILVKVAAMALRVHPKSNASVQGDTILVWKQIHIGLAMEVNDALIVPVIRNADLKTIREIDVDISELIRKTGKNRLSPDDLVNGTFTITNLGFADIDHFTPIIRPPESAILGVGRILKKPCVRDDQVVPEARIALSLTFDHRTIDGAPGARFLKTIKEIIEDPLLLIC